LIQTAKYKKKETAHNYIIIFFLSMEHFAVECFEIEAIKTLFNKQYSKEVFQYWWNIRDTILLVNNLSSGILTACLSGIFLGKSEVRVVIEKVRNSEPVKKEIEGWILDKETEIKELRKNVRNGKQLSKSKLEKYERLFKIGKTNSAPVAFKLLHYFMEDDDVEPGNFRKKERRRSRMPPDLGRMTARTSSLTT
jgi:L-rhamnose mutarotase